MGIKELVLYLLALSTKELQKMTNTTSSETDLLRVDGNNIHFIN
jgi:hypothetical protein